MTPKDQLLASHDEFRKLAQEHTQYAQRLESLTQKRYLTEDEKLEEVRLKKLKLRLKDQMQSIERQFQQDVVQNQVAYYPAPIQGGAGRRRGGARNGAARISA